jgi:nucleoside-diphosphate-sugar epimerase
MNPVILNDMSEMFASEIVDWSRFHGKTVLVTGAYGMLASYIVFMLIFLNETVPGANIRILALGRSRKKLAARFDEYLGKDYFVPVIQDVCASLDAIPRADFIIHATSLASPHFYGVCPVDVALPNVTGTLGLLEKARLDASEGLLFFSSLAAQGLIEGDRVIAEQDMGYLDPMDIRSCYGESKRMGENLCKSYHYQYGVSAKVVRPTHTYGPTMDLNDSRVFSNFVADAVAGRDIKLLSDGSGVRVFCYLSDATLGYFKVLLDGLPGEAYNVTEASNTSSIKDLAVLIARLSGSRTQVISASRTAGDSYIESSSPIEHPVLSSDKLKHLGWECRVGLEEGFRRTIESFVGRNFAS